jgi:hypothetical protein
MALVKGPFSFKWGANTINNVSDISIDYNVDSSDTSTLDGNKYTVETGQNATVTLTLLDNDIASLAVLFPQFYVAPAGVLSTGETVTQSQGAIDIKLASCTTTTTYNQLDIYSCGTNDQVVRLVRCRTRLDSVDIGDGLRTVSVQFIGEPLAGKGALQFLQDNEVFVS